MSLDGRIVSAVRARITAPEYRIDEFSNRTVAAVTVPATAAGAGAHEPTGVAA